MSKAKNFSRCPCCKRPYSDAEIAERKLRKIQNAHRSRLKAAANGKRVGRRRTVSPDKVFALRANGLSFRKIASELGVHMASVYRAAKLTKESA